MYYLLSHNDLDGVGCGILMRCAFGDGAEVRYNSVAGLNYQVERFLEQPDPDTHLIITDLSVHEENEEKLNEYVAQGGKVNLIDHHKTALHLNDREWAAVTVEYEDGRLASATSLLYDFLIENGWVQVSPALDEFVELVRQYDTWEWEMNKNETAKRLNDLFFLLSIDEFEKKMVKRLQMGGHFFLDDFEEKLLDMENEKIERYIRRKRRELVQLDIGDFCAGVVHAESYHSELGNMLGKECPHLDYIAILNMGGRKISFRTIHDEIDVSAIAGQFGGGGHAKASGCQLTEEAYSLFVANSFQMEPLREDWNKNVYNTKDSKYGTLYQNHAGDLLYIFPVSEDSWAIEHNGTRKAESFSSFEEAERFLKRRYACWLAKDEQLVQFLQQHMLQLKENQ
ncbi:MAG: DHH family phosphoesterase [Ectobacillus sp.]